MMQRRLLTLLAAALIVASQAAAQDVLLIPDSTGDSVESFDPGTGALIGTVIPSDSGNLSTPIDTALNGTGILVSDQIGDNCQQYSLAGVFIGTLVSGVDNTRGMAANGSSLYMTGGNLDYVPKFNLETGASEGDFIPSGGGGLNSPFDILFRANDVLVTSIDSDNILRYDPTGVPMGVFATNILFGEQMCEAPNGNVLVADFSRNAIIELDPTGVELDSYGVSGPRGCWVLANGNVLTTNGSGVHEVARPGGGIVNTIISGSRRFIQLTHFGATPVQPTTWGRIKNQFN